MHDRKDVCDQLLQHADGRIVEPGDGGIRRRVSSIHGHGQRGFPFALRRQSAGNVVCRMFRIGTREVEARTTNVPKRSEEHTSELQSLMRISYAVFCLKKKKNIDNKKYTI